MITLDHNGAPTRPRRRWWVVSTLLAGLGAAQSAYLLSRVFALSSPTGGRSFDLCSAWFATSCDGTLADPRSWILGVPLAGWGLVYFAALGGLLFLARFVKHAFEAEALLAASLLVFAAFTTGLVLMAAAWLGREPLCPLCVAVHTTSLMALLALWRASDRTLKEQGQRLRDAWRWFGRSRMAAPEGRWKLVGFGSVVLLAALVYQWIFVESALRRSLPAPAPAPAEVIASYRAAPQVAIPVAEQDPHLGPFTAPVQLVVFESLRCPGCRRFVATLSWLRSRFRDHVVVFYKHYPLSTSCNDRLARDMQPGACEAAWAAQAAHRQARFWPFHDALLASGGRALREAVAETVRRLHLDASRFAADQRSDAARERVAEDIALGNRLKIPGTPSVFLDGRLVSSDIGILETLIDYELERRAAELASRQNIMGLGRPGNAGRPASGG